MPRPYPKKQHEEMFRTTCDSCHKPCEVPFKPNGKKPVFCDACFNKTREMPHTSDFIKRKDKMVFDAPAGSHHGNDHHEHYHTPVSDPKFAELKREINSANAKLDKLIDLMSKLSPKKISKKDEE